MNKERNAEDQKGPKMVAPQRRKKIPTAAQTKKRQKTAALTK
jgi:hypothetical protein